MKARCLGVLAGWALLLAPGMAWATDACTVVPEQVGVSGERLARLDTAMQAYVDEQKAAGIVAYVARGSHVVHLRGYGMADAEAGRAMQPDTLFRMASMTKLMTSVAAMTLVEEGRLALEDPLVKYLPAFANPKVAVLDKPGGDVRLEPARRPITIRDLMTHTSGIPYGYGQSGALWKEAGLFGGYYMERDETMADLVGRMAALPLDAQPGERFVYGHSTDILGVVIEKISGMSLEAFLHQRLFGPLGLKDTYFYVPPSEAGRLSAVYAAGPQGLRRADGPDPLDGQGHFVEGPRKVFSGGAGVVSTAADYGRFLQMMLNHGELDGVRILSARAIELMTSNHVGQLFATDFAPRPGMGFGLGAAIMLDPGEAGMFGSAGSYGFSGAYFTHFWVDPEEQMVMIVLTQLRPATDPSLHVKFRTLAYQSVVGPAVTTGKLRCSVR